MGNRFMPPPKLLGYNYSSEEAREAGRKENLLTIRLETNAACNLRCKYCNDNAGARSVGEASFESAKNVIDEARGLGAKSVVVIGGGEPTIYPHFMSLIEHINDNGMIAVVITNAIKISRETAKFLQEQNASILFKLDSLNEKTQDYLAGKKGAYRSIMKGVENLLSISFNKPQDGNLRCGASFVVTRRNYDEIPAIWKFCRDNNIYPNLEDFIPRSRGLANVKKLEAGREKIMSLKEKLLRIDRQDYGYDWLVYTPLSGHGCLQNLYSLYITYDGYVRPCADIDIKLFNIKETKLSEVVKSPFFKFIRNIKGHLAGKCSRCEHNDICVGCRGNAFCTGIREGLGIYEAICREDPLCWKA